MNTTQMMLDSAYPTQDPVFASGSCCFCGCKHGLPEDSLPDGYDPAVKRPPPDQYMSGSRIDPRTRDYRYTSNGNRYRVVRGRSIPDGDYCFNPWCACEPPPSCPRPKYCEAILASVAEAQLTLSRMLKAEADKLDKAIELACDSDQLLEINESVHRTLTAVIFLEQALYLKLQQMQDMCGSCKLGFWDAK